jgi:hypothetical protein
VEPDADALEAVVERRHQPRGVVDPVARQVAALDLRHGGRDGVRQQVELATGRLDEAGPVGGRRGVVADEGPGPGRDRGPRPLGRVREVVGHPDERRPGGLEAVELRGGLEEGPGRGQGLERADVRDRVGPEQDEEPDPRGLRRRRPRGDAPPGARRASAPRSGRRRRFMAEDPDPRRPVRVEAQPRRVAPDRVLGPGDLGGVAPCPPVGRSAAWEAATQAGSAEQVEH